MLAAMRLGIMTNKVSISCPIKVCLSYLQKFQTKV